MTASAWVSLAGQVAGLAGAVYTVASPFITEAAAGEIAAARWSSQDSRDNAKLPLAQDLLKQSRRARIGLSLIAVGFLLQAIATVCG